MDVGEQYETNKIYERPIALIFIGVGIGCLVAAVADDAQTKTAKEANMSKEESAVVSVRYMIDDVNAAVIFYTKHFGFTVEVDSAPAFASVTRGNLRLLLSGEKSSGRQPLPDGIVSGGWNRVQLMVSDIEAEAK
jgi:hypothetical protein